MAGLRKILHRVSIPFVFEPRIDLIRADVSD